MAAVAKLDLDGGVADVEIMLQPVRDILDAGIAGMSRWHDKMHGAGDFRRTDRPDMQVMHLFHARQIHQETLLLLRRQLTLARRAEKGLTIPSK